jgi:hypothetical protein
MELDIQSLFGLHVTGCAQLFSLAETQQPIASPRIWAHIRGGYWSAKIDDIPWLTGKGTGKEQAIIHQLETAISRW